jgi:hypothetical protein
MMIDAKVDMLESANPVGYFEQIIGWLCFHNFPPLYSGTVHGIPDPVTAKHMP